MPSARATSAWLRPRDIRAARVRAQNTALKIPFRIGRALGHDSAEQTGGAGKSRVKDVPIDTAGSRNVPLRAAA